MTARPRYFDALIDPAAVIARTSAAHAFIAPHMAEPTPEPAKNRPPRVADVVRVLLAREPHGTRLLAEIARCSADHMRDVLRRMEAQGAVVRLRQSTGHADAVWALATQETKR